jgi:hypothetical protein
METQIDKMPIDPLPNKAPVPQNPNIETIHTTDQPIINANELQTQVTPETTSPFTNNQEVIQEPSPFSNQEPVVPEQLQMQPATITPEQTQVPEQEPFQPASVIPDPSILPTANNQQEPSQEQILLQQQMHNNMNTGLTQISPPAPPPPPPLMTNSKTIKHEIVDLFWLINYTGSNIGEVPLMCIAYNAQFKNIRVALYSLEDSYQQTYIDTSKCKKLTTFNIFSEKAFEIIRIYETIDINTQPVSIYNLERLHGKQNDNWQPSQTIFHITKQKIQCQVIDMSQNQHIYTFVDMQIDIFLKALKFLINGQSWTVSLISSIMKG